MWPQSELPWQWKEKKKQWVKKSHLKKTKLLPKRYWECFACECKGSKKNVNKGTKGTHMSFLKIRVEFSTITRKNTKNRVKRRFSVTHTFARFYKVLNVMFHFLFYVLKFFYKNIYFFYIFCCFDSHFFIGHKKALCFCYNPC